MTIAHDIGIQKSRLRRTLRRQRAVLNQRNPIPNLNGHFPPLGEFSPIIAGYAPIGTELDIWPLLKFLRRDGRRITLPVITARHQPLMFREWAAESEMEKDQFGILYPKSGVGLMPQLIFVPLLAFTPTGQRLGYGGGFYDRTLDMLRQNGEVFACGVAYAGQEVEHLPTDAHDAPLDGILTEDGFRAFT